MKYRLLGNSGLRVSELCLGAMTFGEEWDWGASREVSRQLLDRFAEAGGNFIDTANKYTEGTSERYIGEFLEGRREEFVVATKYTVSSNPEDINASGNHRKNMMQAVEASLRRLKTDYIDLYWVHVWDQVTPTEEIMRGLDDLVRQGKIHYIGISDAPAWIVSESNMMAELRGWPRFAGLQIEYSLLERTVERELLPMARDRGITVTPWGALGSGLLTGKYTGKDALKEHSRGQMGFGRLNDHNLKIAAVVDEVAGELGYTPSQVALAWVRQQPFGSIIPILGVRKLTQLEDNLGCLDLVIPDEHLARLDEVSRVDIGFPYQMLNNPELIRFAFGNKFQQLKVNNR